MRLTSTDDVELEVHDLGGDGPPLLLCHATGFHGLVWRPLASHLSDRFSLWAVDFRGHGLSTAPDPARGFAWEGFGEDVLAVVDGLGLERPAAIGHSKGGAALVLAEASRPGTFSGLWCYEPIIFPPSSGPSPGEDNPLAAAATRRRATFPSRRAAVESFAAKPPLDVLHPAALDAYVEHGFGDEDDGTVSLRCRPTDEAQVYRMGSTDQAWVALPGVACPTTIACGGPGATITAAMAARIASRLPVGCVEVFEELGHFGPLQDPARVADAAGRDLAGT
ncbi:MAG: alpha/beta hydrolase [Acidimicrobiales bacterium]